MTDGIETVKRILRMGKKKYIVKVNLADDSPDKVEDIIHGDGSSLGPTFDRLQDEAKKFGGSFETWEPTCCNYSFPNEESALRFIMVIQEIFQSQLSLTYLPGSNKKEKPFIRNYKKLPENLSDRITALTPSKMWNIKVKVQILEDDSALLMPPTNLDFNEILEKTTRLTFVNMRCKITGNVRSKPVVLRSAPQLAGVAFQEKNLKEFQRQHLLEKQEALQFGWKEADVFYDSMINQIMVPNVSQGIVEGQVCPEIRFACDSAMILLYDYYGDQFLGWFFYNENLDEVLNFTSYKV